MSQVISWPSFPALINAEEAYEQGGGPSDPAQLDVWEAVMTRFPTGIPVPMDWKGELRASFCWCVSGRLELALRVVEQARGANPDEPDVSRGRMMRLMAADFALLPLSVPVDRWHSGRTPDEQKRSADLAAIRALIQAWINSRDARTVPFYASNGGRSDIASCVEAVASELYFRPDAPLPAHIERARREIVEAVKVYPVAAPGLRALCAQLGINL